MPPAGDPPQFVILGCGYTGRRVAARLTARGLPILTTSRTAPFRLDTTDPVSVRELRNQIQPGARVLYSIPPVSAATLSEALTGRVAHVVYISATGVYGRALDVAEATSAAPTHAREQARLREEEILHAGHWSTLILRAAAIYGPGRGVHESIRQGRHKLWGDGGNFISRIHVDDLAAIAEAALLSDVTGSYPVADEEPCTALEMAAFCAPLVNMPVPAPSSELPPDDTRRANRRVDGRAIRKLLGVELRYPSYRYGIPASIAEELATAQPQS
ncbi:MAG: hypothetical protein FJW20_11665 [Acidimicrobiia bacterium]|nr:hypothetical protein [Acidimicrobiia bacterium]